ncbi:MAG: bifunctional 2-polyprenyl-6-hydroxyphenol methylase/3-demethylubiquinol 3-O-methyltransferase UbiG [Magnetococcales bacterium]|nr:bifunctional 2-polyprenyl-6-hydroxyphenol methylase/3-demethylubiquinol 3-O-methyltransferase UbiG [Magnetococcales bacterium]
MSMEDPAEIRKFEEMAQEWWDPEGKFKPLHQINPLRCSYILRTVTGSEHGTLAQQRILDIGCGGGLLSEAMDAAGASVVGIDRSPQIIGVAKAHQQQSGSRVDYRVQSVEALSEEEPASFDTVLVMEVLEHVPQPAAFLSYCAKLLRPGGHLFFATLNRTWQAWLLAIVGAEYVLRWLPKGTHEYQKLVKPAELAGWLRSAGIQVMDVTGMEFNPLRAQWSLSRNPAVNYLGYGKAPS